MRGRHRIGLLLAVAALSCGTPAAAQNEAELAKQLWAQSPHGAMLSRILPPAVEARDLPQPASEGAR